jgi:sigma-B regulation protein RsbU (phosphoserine phosphatase)
MDEPGSSVGGSSVGVELAGAAPAPRLESIHAYLTDGSMLQLCEAIGRVAGAGVFLLDADGRCIELRPPGVRDADADPWRRVDAPPDVAASTLRASVVVDGRRIGEFVCVPEGDATAEEAESFGALARLLATLTGEFCHEALEMRHRIRELGALFRLSSLLASASGSVDRVLSVGLELAVGVLELDAGSIVLFPPDEDGVPAVDSEAGVETMASLNLSAEWLANPLPLSRGREFDRLVLGGDALAVPDLLDDPRVLDPGRCEAEGVRSFLSVAMLHRERPVGVIRLYGSRPTSFGVADQRLIRAIGAQAATAVNQARLLEVEKHDRAIERQLRLASAVQRRMDPNELPRLPGLDIAARSEPSSELGGDLHDAFVLGEGTGSPTLGMVVGDVVGKGLPAALLMSAVRASLRAHASGGGAVEDVVGRTNRDLCRDSLPNEFATLWFGTVDPATRVLTYCPAGHEPPVLIRARGGKAPRPEDVASLQIGGLVLGISAAEVYRSMSLVLEPGDVVLAYSDGVTDARNFDDEKWGWQRMVDAAVDVLTQDPGAGASIILDNILWSLRRFVGLRRQVDDETLLVLRVGETG